MLIFLFQTAGRGRPARTRGSALQIMRNPNFGKTKWHWPTSLRPTLLLRPLRMPKRSYLIFPRAQGVSGVYMGSGEPIDHASRDQATTDRVKGVTATPLNLERHVINRNALIHP